MSTSLQIRLPDSLKDRVQQFSKKDGVSMNQMILLATTEYIARLEMSENRKVMFSNEKIDKLLAKIPDIPDIPVTNRDDRLPEDWSDSELEKTL